MLSAKVLNYMVDEENDSVSLSLECRYKEFKKVFHSQYLPKGEKLINEIKQDALESCKESIQEWVVESDTNTVIGQFVPVPANFLSNPL